MEFDLFKIKTAPKLVELDELEWVSVKKLSMGESKILDELDEKKKTIGVLFKKGLGFHYNNVRNSVFPDDVSGSRKNKNRAGDKLSEIVEHYELLPENGVEDMTFFDVAGGPGAFSVFLLSKGMKYGYGVTLESTGSLEWYPNLLRNKKFEALWGESTSKDQKGDGNILNPKNQAEIISSVKEKVSIVVSDGGIGVDDMQEEMSAYLITAEVHLMLQTLQEGGSFVCKLFGTRTFYMTSLLLLVSSVFESISVFKPIRSRSVNSEKYLVCKGYTPKEEISDLIENLCLTAWETNKTKKIASLPDNLLGSFSAKFLKSMENMNNALAESQISSIDSVISKMSIVEYREEKVQEMVSMREENGKTTVFFSIDPRTGQFEGELRDKVNVHTIQYLAQEEILMYPFKRFHMRDMARSYDMLEKFVPTLAVQTKMDNLGLHFKGESIPPLNYQYNKVVNSKFEHGVLVFKTSPRDYEIDKLTDYFTEPVRIRATVSSCGISPWNFWLKNAGWCISEMRKMKKEEGSKMKIDSYHLREFLYRNVREATQFKATLSKFIYDHFSAIKGSKIDVLDPFAGWGDRLLGALGSECVKSYTGIDPNKELQTGYSEMLKFFKRKNTKYVVKQDVAENMRYVGQFDLAFSSPPYYNYEVYEKNEKQSIEKYPTFDRWMAEFLFEVMDKIHTALRKGGHIAIHITDFDDRNVCQRLFEHMRDQKWSFMGCIVAESKNRIPIWVWKKN
jgi:23S rRNA U2552 (ribose-2'-O)-methylase RlmE/FtsJ/16S rRNA G966 N2-methylase RsmD